jgi:TolA-binding protein
MKQHIPHALIVALIGCTLGNSAYATDQAVQQELQQQIRESDEHSRKLDEIVRQRELEQALAELKKAELEVQRTVREIDELQKSPAPTPAQPANQPFAGMQPFPTPGNTAVAPTAAVASVEAQQEDPLEGIFLTRMYGLEGNQRATIVYKRSLYHVALGEVMADGIKLVKINRNSVVMSHNGKTREVALSSRDAVKAAFEEQRQREATLLAPPAL